LGPHARRSPSEKCVGDKFQDLIAATADCGDGFEHCAGVGDERSQFGHRVAGAAVAEVRVGESQAPRQGLQRGRASERRRDDESTARRQALHGRRHQRRIIRYVLQDVGNDHDAGRLRHSAFRIPPSAFRPHSTAGAQARRRALVGAAHFEASLPVESAERGGNGAPLLPFLRPHPCHHRVNTLRRPKT
jgi:hypothetical protein